jgi:hypothetical protein
MLRPILLFIHVALVLPAGCSEESPTARETPDAIVHHLGDGAAALPDGPLAMADAAMVDAPIEPDPLPDAAQDPDLAVAVDATAAAPDAAPGDVGAVAGKCHLKGDLYLNPFNKESAHHRPIGSGAQYAAASHPATKDWLKASTLGINVGAPWGVSMAQTVASDPFMTIAAFAKCDGVSQVPVTIRMPKAGFVTKVVYNANGCTDGVVVVHDKPTGKPHQLRQYDWNNGKPRAGQYRTWPIKGLGHGVKPGDRIGTSASGVAAMFGLLRGEEINVAGRPVQHALQMVLPRTNPSTCNVMIGKTFKLPAVSMDGGWAGTNVNTGNIPYGALMALPPAVSIAGLGLSEPGKRLAQALRDYGIYLVDGGGCQNGAIRADQHVNAATLKLLKQDIPKLYKKMRMVLNNDVLTSPVSGGGTPLAPNCAFDAP